MDVGLFFAKFGFYTSMIPEKLMQNELENESFVQCTALAEIDFTVAMDEQNFREFWLLVWTGLQCYLITETRYFRFLWVIAIFSTYCIILKVGYAAE